MPTPLTALLGIDEPVIQAGMARQYTSPALVAAVAEAGGLGVLGCLDRPEPEVVSAIGEIRAVTGRPLGVNFVLHRLDERAFASALAVRVPVFSFFRGADPTEPIRRAHAAGAIVIHQVTTVSRALDEDDATGRILLAGLGSARIDSIVPAGIVVSTSSTRPLASAPNRHERQGPLRVQGAFRGATDDQRPTCWLTSLEACVEPPGVPAVR